ncbi:MAG TPA: tetratricopeptide repeat protein [Solidesulfovibrio magneticus]|nr:tetratricopeptide repeat protein [Solidesulfovibrio magneticus]
MAAPALTQRELIAHEHALRDVFSRFLTFKTHSLYFPKPGDALADAFGPDLGLAAHLPTERKIMIPLAEDGRLLGVFVARGASLGGRRSLMSVLPRIAAMALDQLRLRLAAASDSVTGLATGEALLAALTREIEAVQQRILPGGDSLGDLPLSACRGGFGLIVADLDRFSRVAGRFGFLMAEDVLARAGAAVAGATPEGGLAARLHDDLFAVFLPGASAGRCREAAEALLAELGRTPFPIPATGESLSLTASAGCVSYPQDVRGGQFAASPAEQARLLVHKAKKGLAVAKDLGRDQAMAYSRILAEGGVVLETLPLARAAVSLGRWVDAEPGQRFLVWSPRLEREVDVRGADGGRLSGRSPAAVKGEIVLAEVVEDMAFAEVLHLADPHLPLEPGDRLALIPEAEEGGDAAVATGAPRRDPASGLYPYRDFQRATAQAREKNAVFSQILVQLADPPARRRAGRPAEADMAEAAGLCRRFFGHEVVGGRFSASKLVFFVPGIDPANLAEPADRLLSALRADLELDAAVGLAGHPCLDYARSDVAENCRKALDHALLLPAGPRLAVFDSLSLTVSGDRHFAVGDVYAAMEEYKQALLADEKNALARNSLGICLARLGRLPQARAEFERVIRGESKNAMALYNLGCVLMRQGESAAARAAFQKCLRADPAHVSSLLRLGRMAEENRRFAEALKYYRRALAAGGPAAPTLRHLARLAFARGQLDAAREHLHQALLRDPKDAFALQLMARVYLTEGEDPAIAEAMARQAVALRPERREFWVELSRALAAQGRDDEARDAAARAEGV